MSYIRTLLRGADERDTLGASVEVRDDLGAGPGVNYHPAPAEPASMIVRVAETYLKAHDNYTRAEIDLTHRIDALVEERRQMRAAISSTEAGLYPISEDPALSDEMKKRIAAAFSNSVRVTLDDVDLT